MNEVNVQVMELDNRALPFEPESEESVARRFPLAVNTTIPEEMLPMWKHAPQDLRRVHVFDVEKGKLRMRALKLAQGIEVVWQLSFSSGELKGEELRSAAQEWCLRLVMFPHQHKLTREYVERDVVFCEFRVDWNLPRGVLVYCPQCHAVKVPAACDVQSRKVVHWIWETTQVSSREPVNCGILEWFSLCLECQCKASEPTKEAA